ncbi:uncharacterized protein CCR75_009510 [Bremia lactucae]|uniref:Uncharacterized protein n=1 Tax=Bremia lactucae TaxID=4779 RepID=A0A976FFG0_BRELC|nr:hypothetical protein CCR75_009510 [Bremia lactucae]
MFCFDDAIVEYRENIGIPGKSMNTITGVAPCYMGTYASVGIPESRYNWIVGSLAQIDVIAGMGERDNCFNGYVWTTANITNNYYVPVLMSIKGKVVIHGSADKNLMHVIRQIKSNVIGVVGVEMTLKRSKDYGVSGRRNITLSLKSMQVCDLPEKRSPPLTKAVVFESSGKDTTDRLLARLTAKARAITIAEEPAE